MDVQEAQVLEAAVHALHRTTGLTARMRREPAAGAKRKPEALVEIEAGDRRRHRFIAEVKAVHRFATPALVKAQWARGKERPLLVAPYISRETAQRCRDLQLAFIDTAGNAYLEGAGLLVYVTGQRRPAELNKGRFRALTAAGLQIAFALICRPRLIGSTYREVAAAAMVALGTVGPVLRDLEARRFIRFGAQGERAFLDARRLLQEWVTHYPITLRPKLNPRRFEADPDRLRQAEIGEYGACWGGEPAADKLTHFLRPVMFTIYAHEPIAKLVAANRMRANRDGNVEILEIFWDFPADPEYPHLVPPVLAYADLLATNDSRNMEAARLIYEQRIEPNFLDAG